MTLGKVSAREFGKYAPQREVTGTGSPVPALPDLVESARRDYRGGGSWCVEDGLAERGDAWTDFTARRMRLPVRDQSQVSSEGQALAQAVRAHELAHLRISPDLSLTDSSGEYDPVSAFTKLRIPVELLTAVEEWRVNQLVKRSGVDIDLLRDGSERLAGERARDHNSALTFLVATHGTKAQKDFLLGVKSKNPEMYKSLLEAKRALTKITKSALGAGSRALFDTSNRTEHVDEGVEVDIPQGFLYSVYVAKEMAKYWAMKWHDQKRAEEQAERGVTTPTGEGRGIWGPLVFDPNVIPTKPVAGALLKKRNTPSQRGRKLRYPTRILTDPEKRVFSGSSRIAGGVVVIDCSGSMNLEERDVTRILDSAPMATIFGYSHLLKFLGGAPTPSAWLLAWNGKRLESLEPAYEGWSHNVGNGCDGPAIEHAIAIATGRSRPGLVSLDEARNAPYTRNVPVFWVCDGQLTDSVDTPASREMMKPIVALLRKHRVRVAPDVETACRMLEGREPAYSIVRGRLGRMTPRSMGGLL